MIVIGIDPGKAGGLTRMLVDAGEILSVSVIPMPLFEDEVSVLGVKDFLDAYESYEKRVFLEKTNAFYQSSAKSAYAFGRSVMVVEAAIQCLGLSYEMVLPREWMKEILKGYPKKDKGDKPSLRYVVKKYPAVDLVPVGKKVPRDGMSDSVCIAEFGVRKIFKERGL